MKKRILVLAIVFISGNIFGQRVIDAKFGKGIFNIIAADSSWSMKFGARFQTLFVGAVDLHDSLGPIGAESNFLIRRSRLKFDGFAFSPKLKYKMEFGLSNRDMSGVGPETKNTPRYILDAVVKWNFAGNWTIWAGQTKLPGNRERVVSSGNLQFVDRSLVNSKYNIDRDMGIQLRHHFTLGENFIVREIAALSQGEGRNITAGNLGGYDWTGRLEFLPFGKFKSKGDYTGSDTKREETPKLSVGVTYDYHDRAVRKHGNTKDFMYNDVGYYETNIATVFADLMFKYKGFSVMAEYAQKNAEDAIAKNTDGSVTGDNVYEGTGLNFQLGYLMNNNFELSGRFTNITPTAEIGGEPINMYTLGFSRYVVGHKLKVQSDISYTIEEGSDDNLMYRLQIDLHF
ncbi:MAG: porin [Crocinitomicaceae bacterium]|jgi:phosphate-selective porin OprO and OprP|nr:porin [Crocinitomicaceae bacterium]MBT5404019.1 porin [Crocinitomicaceae bacterium]MBT6514292.1 porin [Crocinitomicaceae bacterium]